MKKAIYTIASGKYEQIWSEFAAQSWRAFCSRNDYDLHCFNQPLDCSERALNRSIAWQKLIAHESPELSGYDVLIWLDADFVINPLSPDPLAELEAGRVGGCYDFTWGNDVQTAFLAKNALNEAKKLFAKSGIDFQSFQKLWGVNPSAGILINTGFLIFRPSETGFILRYVYDNFDEKPSLWGEMVPLSEELHRRSIFQLLDQRYNLIIWQFVQAFVFDCGSKGLVKLMAMLLLYRLLNIGYFLHFASWKHAGMPLMAGATWDEMNGFRPDSHHIATHVQEALQDDLTLQLLVSSQN